MSYTLDQTTDYSHRELHTFLHGINPPDFVKQAELDTKESVAKLDQNAFADRYNRAYPIHNPAATYVSHAHFINKRASLEKKWGVGYAEEVATRLKQAAEIHKIAGDIEAYNQHVTKTAAAAPEEKVVYAGEIGGQPVGLFAYKTAADLVKHAADFTANINDYPFDLRRPIAENFYKLAVEHGIDELPDLLCKYAGLFFPHTQLFVAELERRKNKLAAEHQPAYDKIIEKVASAACSADYYDICAQAYAAEKQAGAWDHKATRRLLGDIVDTTHTLSAEKIASLLNVVEMAGNQYDLSELQKVSKDIYKEAFGVDLDPTSQDSLRDVLPTMPLSDVALFRELSGVAPLS